MSKNSKKNVSKYVRSPAKNTSLVPHHTTGNPVLSRDNADEPSLVTKILPGPEPVTERIVVSRRVSQSFNGPIPHPDIFRKYGEVIADAPERILAVFEADSAHIREIQMGALVAQKADNKRVHWMACGLIAGGYVMSGLFAWMNKDVLAGIVLTTTIIGTVTGFLQTRNEEAKPGKADAADEPPTA